MRVGDTSTLIYVLMNKCGIFQYNRRIERRDCVSKREQYEERTESLIMPIIEEHNF